MTNEEIELLEKAKAIIYWDGYNSTSNLHIEECNEVCKKLQDMIDKYSHDLTSQEVEL